MCINSLWGGVALPARPTRLVLSSNSQFPVLFGIGIEPSGEAIAQLLHETPINPHSRLQITFADVEGLQSAILDDKYAEVLHSSKEFFLDVWKKKMPDLGEDLQHVWRVEGQVRRPILKELEIHSIEALQENPGALWNFITGWASLRLPDDPNTSRRSLNPL